MPVWGAILLAVAATVVMNTGLSMQKRAASALPRIGRDRGAGRAFFSSRVWLAGTAFLLTGWGLYLASTNFAPISIIQPALGSGLAVMVLFSIFYLGEKIRPAEWGAVAGMAAGMVMLGLSATHEGASGAPDWPAIGMICAIVVGAAASAYILRRRGGIRTVSTDSLLGIVSGLFIGLGALFTRAMFLHLQAGEDALGLGVCLPALVSSNIVGVGVMQSGFQLGKALVVVSIEAVLGKAVAIGGGMWALGERLPEDGDLAAMRIAAFVLILTATAVLARFGGERPPPRGPDLEPD